MNIKHILFCAVISVCFSEVTLAQELVRNTKGRMDLEDPNLKYGKHFEIYSENVDDGACASTVIFYKRDIATGNEIVTSRHISKILDGEFLLIKVGRLSWRYLCNNGIFEKY